ncbi:hypothetical protein L2E82_26124 [Cichorium intybus]|uniref:Uncharacterized protein n=1 Tax=Cichorium intybus TaxID=13427 RepID=A0ACB9E6C8_CICIN|nr:hypothetical protein L2E82_26124 [Cichorium intybus]
MGTKIKGVLKGLDIIRVKTVINYEWACDLNRQAFSLLVSIFRFLMELEFKIPFHRVFGCQIDEIQFHVRLPDAYDDKGGVNQEKSYGAIQENSVVRLNMMTVTLEGSTAVQNIAIGCGDNNEGLFVGAARLIGLGGGALSFPSQINATSYSYCLVDRDSDAASTLDFNSPMPHDAITAPLLRSTKLDTFYYIGLRGLSVAGQLLHIPSSTF